MKPYNPPLLPSSITHVALTSKSYRIFGLDDPAWRNARADWKKYKKEGLVNHNDKGGHDDAHDDREEGEEMELICNAVETALSDDAGGFGTAGFHVSKVENVQLISDSQAVYNATLIPCDVETSQPIVPASVLNIDEDTGNVKYSGNDEFYLTRSPNSKFQLRVTISKANVALATKEYHDALFAKRAELGDDIDLAQFNVDAWVEEDEELCNLRQKAMETISGEENGNNSDAPLGYYVEVMLLEPHVKPTGVAIAPPSKLDKQNVNFRPVTNATCTRDKEEESKATDTSESIFHSNVYNSCQFDAPGPWEKTNMKVFGDMVLDVRKSLVRVEFPVFPEGCKSKTFREVYQLNARLKSGSFATVCRGTHRATGKKIAVKCVLRKDLPPNDDAAIYDEVLILSTLRHPYICPLVDFFEERECYFLIMELMSGGDLFDRIGQRKSYTENDARDLCRKLLGSLRYCHENSVAHCDLKPKNLLLASEDDDVRVKLADFGFATRVYQPKSLVKQCGTPFFVAPEVLMRSPYDQQSDMWSCGVIMFLLLAGDLPFVGRSQKELFRNIVMGKYEFDEESWGHISEPARDLVKQLLVTDPSKRLTSSQAMKSSWMDSRRTMLDKNNLQFTSQRLKGFNARLKMRASIIAVSTAVSWRMSVRSSGSARSITSVGVKKVPSFLDLPDEGAEDEEKDLAEEQE